MGLLRESTGCTGSACIAVLLSIVMQPTWAEELSGWDRLQITVAGYRPSIDSKVRLDTSDLIPGTQIDLENDLALGDTETLWQGFVTYRILRGFSAEVGYYEIGRSGDTTLDSAVQFGGTTFPVSADVDTTLDMDITALSFRYSLVQTESLEIAASLGAYLLDVTASIASAGAGLSESAAADAPLPLAGMGLAWNVSPKLQLTLHGQYLGVDIEDFDGSIGNYRAGLQYRLFEHLGIGVGYEVFDLDLESEYVDFPGIFEVAFKGPKAFLALRF